MRADLRSAVVTAGAIVGALWAVAVLAQALGWTR